MDVSRASTSLAAVPISAFALAAAASLASALGALAAEPGARRGANLLEDPGFEESQDPDRYGNPFAKWGGWRWEGDCERRRDARVKRSGRSSGLLLGQSACKVAFIQTVRVEPGAPFYMLSACAGWTGIDTELLNQRVNDVVLNECHASTVTTDLLESIAGGRKLHQDREYHGDIAHVFSQFLHGMGYLNMWHWPEAPSLSPRSFYLDDVARSPKIPLEDVAIVLRDALDLRRLGREILRFHGQRAELAILYSMDSLLQIPPRLRNARDCPHSLALKTLYEGLVACDAPVGFTTERKIAGGDLARIRLLVLPAVHASSRKTQGAIAEWTRAGGALVLIPPSWLEDERGRTTDALAELGVRVAGARLPGGKAVPGRPDVERASGFVMGPMGEEDAAAAPRARGPSHRGRPGRRLIPRSASSSPGGSPAARAARATSGRPSRGAPP